MRYVVYLLIISLVFLRFLATRPVYKEGDLIRVSAKVTSQPTFYENFQSFSLHGLRIGLPRYPEIDYGDSVVLTGRVKDGRLTDVNVESIKKSTGKLVNLRKKIISFYSKNLPINYSALVSGVVIGDKTSLNQEFRDKLIKTGVVHVVVASGMNVTFVAGFLIFILTRVLKRNTAIPFVLVGIFMYVVLSGFDAPIVRAAIMGSITFLAQETGRLSSAWRALVISVVLMLIAVPSWIFDLGFILSFVATASLLIFQKKIDQKIKFVPKTFREGLSTSLAAQIGVAPIIFVTFGQFNILSPIINALVLWTIPFIMVIGAISGIVGVIFPLVGKLILIFVYPFAGFFEWVVNIFS